jgi:peptide/nickel transport system substrate-binding protein
VLRSAIRTRALAALSVAAFALVAVSCGDDDDNASNATSGSSAAEATTEGGSSEATTSPSSGATTEGGGGGGEPSANSNERRPEDPPNPVQGGTLVYGLEADTTNPWAPYNCSCATSGRDVLKAISDALFTEDPEGKPVPLLLESVDHSDDYTQWTMHVRDGIKFHDGTPLDGAAVKFNIDTCLASPLTATAFAQIDRTEASGQDVTLFTKSPWVSLPTRFLDYGTCSFMFSPKWMGSLANVPQRDQKTKVYDATLAATPANGDALKPVGLGAFMYKSYTPGNGNAFVAVRNPDYWRGPNGITGEQLPYLDEIQFVVAVDEDGRSNSVRSGDFDAMFTSMGDTIKQFLDDDSFEVNSSSKFADTIYIMLNVATGDADPEGKNTANPLLNVDCRRALAGAIDRDRWTEDRMAGVTSAANGPFPPGSLGYLDDNGYPAYDVSAAQANMDKCLAGLKTDHIEFSYNTTNDPFNVESNQLIISMWNEAFGDKVKATITPIEQGQYIGLALNGTFQAFGWRSHFGSDPDEQRTWWYSGAATPIGQLALNFGRFKDPVIDKALDTISQNPDEAARKEAAETINKQFGSEVYNMWLTWVLWGIISQPYVHGVQANKLPDGGEGIGLAFLAVHNFNQMWCDGGKCE